MIISFVCVLINGRVQKELANGTVPVPFGCEYTLRFRNKNSRRAVVKFFIDGENVSGNGYIVPANDCIDIKRHHDKDAAFQFVSLDSPEAVDAGKNGPNPDKSKGVIEARFYLEKEKSVVKEVHHYHHYEKPLEKWPEPTYPNYPHWWNAMDTGTTVTSGGGYYTCGGDIPSELGTIKPQGGLSAGLHCSSLSQPVTKSVSPQSFNFSADTLQDGCTVEGCSTGHNFSTAWIDTEEDYTLVKLFLQGYDSEKAVIPHKVHETVKDKHLRELEEKNKRLKDEIARKLAEQEKSLEKNRLLSENDALKKKLEELK